MDTTKVDIEKILKHILNFPGILGLFISVFFIFLSISMIGYVIFFSSSLVFDIFIYKQDGNYFLDIIKITEYLLISLLFSIISYGIVKIIYKSRIHEIDKEGVLPFENIQSIEDLEKLIFGILTFQFLIILLESLLYEGHIILISKGISISLIIIALSIYLHLEGLQKKAHK